MKRFYVILTIILSIFLLSSCFGSLSTDTDRDTSGDSSRESDTSVGTSSDIHQGTDTNTSSDIGGFGSDIEVDSSTNSDTPPPQKELFTVFFDSNSGSEVANIEVVLGSTLDAPKTTRVGYKFDAWLTEDGEIFDFGEPISSSFTLYASWLPDKVMIYFDANGGSGELEPIEATTESKIVLPTPEFERYGYFFQGWSLDPNGTYDYYADKEYTVMGEGNTLYAIWGKTTCYIRYHWDGGKTIYEAFSYEDLPITLEKPRNELGYCEGWYNITYSTEITEITELESIDVYQRWVGVHFSHTTSDATVYSVDNIFESLTIPETFEGNPVLHVRAKAFKDCDKLTSLTLPDTISKINEYAFEGCTSLVNIDFPSDFTIGIGIFKDCSSLAEISLPSCITKIPHYTFDGCTSLEQISVGKDFDSIPNSCFSGCKRLNSINVDPQNQNFKTVNGNILSLDEKKLLFVAPAKATIEDAIPSTITTIDSYAFSQVQMLKHMVIPDHVIRIERDAFSGAKSIMTLDTGKIASIPRDAFAVMPSLVTLKIGEATKSVGERAFFRCEKLTSVTLEGEFKSFASDAFERCNKILEVFNLTGISSEPYGGVFANCISSHFLPGTSMVEIDGDFVFFTHPTLGLFLVSYLGTESIVTIPEREATKYTILDYTFNYCDTITEVIIPDSVTSIYDFAFYSCTNLQKATIGKGVAEMSGVSFHLSKKFFTIELDEGNASFVLENNVVYTADKSTLVRYIDSDDYVFSFAVPEGVTTISNGAFEETKLLTLTLPSTLVRIGDYAFFKTPVSSFVIPSAVNYIGLNAFNEKRLLSVTFETLYEWRIKNGWFPPESLSDPAKNAEFIIESESSWAR